MPTVILKKVAKPLHELLEMFDGDAQAHEHDHLGITWMACDDSVTLTNGAVSQIVTVAGAALIMLQNGTLEPISKKHVKDCIDHAVAALLGKIHDELDVNEYSDAFFEAITDVLTKGTPEEPSEQAPGGVIPIEGVKIALGINDVIPAGDVVAPVTPPVLPLKEGVPQTSGSNKGKPGTHKGTWKQQQSAKTALSSAGSLGQAVKSTSNGSVYHVVALGEELAMSARWTHRLSIRFERRGGGPLGDLATALSSTGLNLKKDTQYASVHLDYKGDDVLALKTLGAVCFALNEQLPHTATNLKGLKGVGK